MMRYTSAATRTKNIPPQCHRSGEREGEGLRTGRFSALRVDVSKNNITITTEARAVLLFLSSFCHPISIVSFLFLFE